MCMRELIVRVLFLCWAEVQSATKLFKSVSMSSISTRLRWAMPLSTWLTAATCRSFKKDSQARVQFIPILRSASKSRIMSHTHKKTERCRSTNHHKSLSPSFLEVVPLLVVYNSVYIYMCTVYIWLYIFFIYSDIYIYIYILQSILLNSQVSWLKMYHSRHFPEWARAFMPLPSIKGGRDSGVYWRQAREKACSSEGLNIHIGSGAYPWRTQ